MAKPLSSLKGRFILALAALILLPALATRSPAEARLDLSSTRPDRPFTEEVNVTIVLIPVVVRDASGRPVTDLVREDFTVLEEGVPQPLDFFGREARPVSIVLALDTSWSMRPHELAVKSAALEFVKGQREGTAFALEVFNDVVLLEKDFTESRKAAEDAIGALRAQGENTALYDALAAASRHLEKREGGRIVVLFTDGTETVQVGDGALGRLGEAIADAVRRDVSVYTVAFGPKAARLVLDRMSAETGGESFTAGTADDLRAAFAHVAESVGSRYLLSYRLPRPGSTGYRKIDVRVARPGLRVAARKGYYAR